MDVCDKLSQILLLHLQLLHRLFSLTAKQSFFYAEVHADARCGSRIDRFILEINVVGSQPEFGGLRSMSWSPILLQCYSARSTQRNCVRIAPASIKRTFGNIQHPYSQQVPQKQAVLKSAEMCLFW